MNSIIETKDLKLWYGDHQVLKGITMDIPEHQITALIGPSGCGKSTFLKTLNRMNDLVENVRITGERKECLPGRASGEQGFFHWEFFIEQKRREW